MSVLSWKEIKTERVNEQVSRQMFWGEHIMLVRWELAPDVTFPVHEHVSEQVTIMDRGWGTLIFPEGEEITLHEGEMLVIPPSKPHGVRVGPEGQLVPAVAEKTILFSWRHEWGTACRRPCSDSNTDTFMLCTTPPVAGTTHQSSTEVAVPVANIR